MTAGRQPPPGPSAVADNEILEYVTDPMVFLPGHQLRGVRCLACATLIGGQVFTVHQTVAMNQPACDCGGLCGTIYLLCADCAHRGDIDLVSLAIVKASTHHGGPK